MLKQVVVPLAMAASLVVSAVAQEPGSRPDPHRGAFPGGSASTPAVAADPGCDLVVDYYRDLNRAFFRADDFFAYMGDDTEIEELTARQARTVIASGDALVADLRALDVPPAYAEGNEGIITLMQVNIDLINFYALDSSSVPNVNAFDDSMLQIYNGEVALVEACPDEVDEIGGYVMYDPNELKQDLGLD